MFFVCKDDVYAGILSWKIGNVRFNHIPGYYNTNFNPDFLNRVNSDSRKFLFFYGCSDYSYYGKIESNFERLEKDE
jgi:hypothetical protein